MTFRLKLVAFFILGVAVGFGMAFGHDWLGGYVHSFPESRTALSFSVPGRLSFIAPVGTSVVAGEVVARLDDTAFQQTLASAENTLTLQKAEAALAQDAAQQATVQQSRAVVKDTRLLGATLATLASSTAAAVATTDPLFVNPTASAPQLLVPADALSTAAAVSGRMAVSGNVSDLAADAHAAASASSSPVALSAIADSATGDIAEVQLFLESIAILTSQASTTSTVSTATLAGWRNDITLAQAGIAETIRSLLAAQNTLINDEHAFPSVAVTASALANAAATTEATISSTTAALAAEVIQAPEAGTIVAPNASGMPKLGQQIEPGQSVAVLTFKP